MGDFCQGIYEIWVTTFDHDFWDSIFISCVIYLAHQACFTPLKLKIYFSIQHSREVFDELRQLFYVEVTGNRLAVLDRWWFENFPPFKKLWKNIRQWKILKKSLEYNFLKNICHHFTLLVNTNQLSIHLISFRW